MEGLGIRSSHWTKELKDTLQVKGPKTVCYYCLYISMKLVNTGMLSPDTSTASIYSDFTTLLTSQNSSKKKASLSNMASKLWEFI